jgi:ABC-type methionine transport system ATPase subunit
MDVEKGSSRTLLGIQSSVAIVGNRMDISQKIINKIANLTAGYVSEENETSISKRHPYSHVHCSIVHNSQQMKTI